MKKRMSKKVKSLLDRAEKAYEFPDCTGSFDDCPLKEVDAHSPPARCFKCPKYTESRYYRPPKIQMDDFAKQVFSKD